MATILLLAGLFLAVYMYVSIFYLRDSLKVILKTSAIFFNSQKENQKAMKTFIKLKKVPNSQLNCLYQASRKFH